MVNESTTDPAGATPTERWVGCEIPGCAHRMPYAGRGAPPKYCGQTVAGVRHTRLTAYRLAKGQLTLPSPAGDQAAAVEGEWSEGHDEQARPVTAARMTLELLVAEVSAQVVGHEQRMGVLAEQISQAVRTAADADAVAAEVSAAHRGARAEVDRAEDERDQAIGQARAALRAAEAAEERATMAELAAEEALAESETAHLARDQAIGERDKHSVAAAVVRDELADARAQADELREQVATLQQDISELTRARTELARQLATEQEVTRQQRQRAESAERHAIRTAAQVEQLSTELTTARGQLEHWQAQAADLGAELAGVRSELAAAHVAAQTEHDHAAQRLADQQAHYEQLISALRIPHHQPGAPQRDDR